MEIIQSLLDPKNVGVMSVIFRLLVTCVLSGVIGLERGFRGRAAGLRTHILVGVGSCVTAMTGIYASLILGTGDPFRIAAQVMSGIGFLGAGTILVYIRYLRIKVDFPYRFARSRHTKCHELR